MQTNTLTQERALEVFTYDDGKLLWNISKSRVTKGQEAGCIKSKGYRYVCVDNVHYRVHRIIFLMFHGYVPPIIDHIDNDKLNNRIENLKEISNSENLRKTPIRITKTNDKWILYLTKHYGYKLLGTYDSLEQANIDKRRYKEQLGL